MLAEILGLKELKQSDMKICTNIEQSKKLAEFLPKENADMWWNFYSVTTDDTTPQIIHLDTPWVGSFNWDNKPDNVPCWSLAALLELIRNFQPNNQSAFFIGKKDGYQYMSCVYLATQEHNNPVDACYEMILRLHEQNLL